MSESVRGNGRPQGTPRGLVSEAPPAEDSVPHKGHRYIPVIDLEVDQSPIMSRGHAAQVVYKTDGARPQSRASRSGTSRRFFEDSDARDMRLLAESQSLAQNREGERRQRQKTRAEAHLHLGRRPPRPPSSSPAKQVGVFQDYSHPARSTQDVVLQRPRQRPATPCASSASRTSSDPRAGSRYDASQPAPRRPATPSSSRAPSWSAAEHHAWNPRQPSVPTVTRDHFLSSPETSFRPGFSDHTNQTKGSPNTFVPSTVRPHPVFASTPPLPPPSQQFLTPSRTTARFPSEISPVGRSSGRAQRCHEIPGASFSSRRDSLLDPFLADQPGSLSMMEEAQALDAEQRLRAQDDIRKLLKMPNIEIPPEQRAQTPYQMSCRLMEHQKVALKWLKDQENNRHKRGALLADTMGLGKTIEALALILDHRAPDADPKTTLIIAPLAVLRQWDREIASKVKPAHRLSTFLYHGSQKKSRKASKLFDLDIVITTYETVSSEYRTFLSSRRRNSRIFGPGKRFHRIILDEAHKIKNRFAQCSIAVAALDAKYRLCMTGTVFMNNAAEIYALIRFLRIKPYDDWPHFKEDIGGPLGSWDEDEQAAAMRKLQVLFRSITLRRTKDSQLDGKPIITLPKLSITSTPAVFNKDQQAYYDALEARQQIRLNKYLKQGQPSRVYTFILVLLLRLRQACCHPFLIKNYGIPDETELNGKQMVQLAMKFDPTVVDGIMRRERFQCPLCDETAETPMIIYPCGHHICSDCFSSMMQIVPGATNNADSSQLFLAGDAEMESICPHDGCDVEVNPKNVVCHDFFLDAHSSSDCGSQNDADAGTDQQGDGSSEWDENEDTDDDEASLKGFIVPDDEEDGVDEGTDNEGSETESRPCAGRTPTPDALVNSDDDAGQAPADRGPAPAEDQGSVVEKKPGSSRRIKEDIWSGVLSRYRQSKEARNDVDSDSDDSFMSVRNLTARSKVSEAGSVQTDLPNKSATKSKRRASGEAISAPKKRLRRDGETAIARRANKAGPAPKRKGKRKEPTLGHLRKAATTGSKAAKAKYLARLRKDFESSAKIDVTLDLLRTIRDDKPGEKTLVFSLWTSFLDLLEIPLREEGFRYLRYDGGMSSGERDDSVRRFAEDPGARVLLVSLMAGNAGLNLTAASQVVVLEPFWNPFVEDQAVDRAHRIGQRRRVEVHRVLVARTVEDRILELQEGKRRLVGAALSEEGARGAGRLSVGELKGLFGIR